MSKESYIAGAVDWATKKGIGIPKVNFDGYEKPKSYHNSSTDVEVCPDLSFMSMGGAKNYSEIALKQDDEDALITRWKLLSTMANLKRGKLFLLAPRGHKMFTHRLIDAHNINAVIRSI